MKRYVDRLARVLGVRQVQEKQARTKVAQARGELVSARSHQQTKRERFEEHAVIDGPIPYVHHRLDRTLWELKALALLDAEEKAISAEHMVAVRLGEWAAAAQRVEALDRLNARRKAEHRHEADQAETRENDDLVNGRRGRDGKGDEIE